MITPKRGEPWLGGGADTAAGVAAAYRGGGKSDWFLPSMNDFNQVWQQRSSNPAFLQPDTNYWTSSQAEVNIPEALKMAIELSNADWDESAPGRLSGLNISPHCCGR